MKYLYNKEIGDYLIVEKCEDCSLVNPVWNQCGICNNEEQRIEIKPEESLKHIKIGDMQKVEEEYEKEQKQEKQRKREMFKSFKEHGRCPDYKAGECNMKCGVYVCWDTDKHRKYRCPIINYEG